LVPLALFWFFFSRVPGVSAAQAKALLNSTNSAAVLVDVRPAAAYSSNHVAGAVNWPFEVIASLTSTNDIPPSLQGKNLLLLCDVGFSSACATRKLRALGMSEARNVTRGLEGWLAYGDGKKSDLPFRAMSSLEQWSAVTIAFLIKPIYMTLSLLLMIWIWRQRAADLTALRWGLIWFWIGENACSIDFLFFKRASDFWEFLHGYGMAVSFSFIAYAFLEGFDHRVVKFSPEKERCAALSLCRACVKYSDAPCGLKRLFTVMIPALAVLALMPLTAGFQLASYDTIIVGTAHNYYHLPSSQLLELRYCPALALILFAAAWLVLLFKRHEPVAASKVLLAAATGPLSFGMLRMFFVASFSDRLVWFDVWEEITELLSILSIGLVLWVFRHSLFVKAERPAAAGSDAEPARA
jgi:rhodanese-related sulfurtransferase